MLDFVLRGANAYIVVNVFVVSEDKALCYGLINLDGVRND